MIYNNLESLLCRFKSAKLQKNPFRMEVVLRKNTYNGPLVVEIPGKYDLYTFDGSQSHEEWR